MCLRCRTSWHRFKSLALGAVVINFKSLEETREYREEQKKIAVLTGTIASNLKDAVDSWGELSEGDAVKALADEAGKIATHYSKPSKLGK